MFPGLRVPRLVLPVLHLIEIRSSLGEGIQVLLASVLVPIAAKEGLDYGRIFNLHHHSFGLAILSILTGNVDSNEVRQTVFADEKEWV